MYLVVVHVVCDPLHTNLLHMTYVKEAYFVSA